MDYNYRETGLARECFENHTPNMNISEIKKATIAAGNIYLREYAAKMKEKNEYDEYQLKSHLKQVYDAFVEDGCCDSVAWALVLKELYPIIDDRNIVSDLINKNADLFPDIKLKVTGESVTGIQGELTDKAQIYGHLVQKTCEQISSRFGNLLKIKIQ